MSAKKNAVACNLRHVRAHSYQVNPLLADTEQELGTKAERKNTHTHTTHTTHRHHPGGGGHTNGVRKTHPDSQSDLKRVRAHHLGLPNDTTPGKETELLKASAVAVPVIVLHTIMMSVAIKHIGKFTAILETLPPIVIGFLSLLLCQMGQSGLETRHGWAVS